VKPGFLLEAARRDVKSTMRGGVGLCVLCLIVLALNGRYVYNWMAGPFEVDPVLAELPGAKEFAQVSGNFIPTPFNEVRTSTLRIFRVVASSTTDVSANVFLVSVGPKFLVVKTAPDFSGGTAHGRLVPLPEKIRALTQTSELKAAEQKLSSNDLCSMMLDATSDYRTDANLFVIAAAFFLLLGLLMIVIYALKSTSPQKYPMLRFVLRSGPLQSSLSRIEQELIAAGDAAYVGPLMISPSWVYDSSRHPLIFPLKDVIGVCALRPTSAKSISFVVRFWLRGESRSHSVEAGLKECEVIMQALSVRIPWAILDPSVAFEARWRRDREGCVAEMERRKRQIQTPPPVTNAPQPLPV
jgi:hypothetical protein